MLIWFTLPDDSSSSSDGDPESMPVVSMTPKKQLSACTNSDSTWRFASFWLTMGRIRSTPTRRMRVVMKAKETWAAEERSNKSAKTDVISSLYARNTSSKNQASVRYERNRKPSRWIANRSSTSPSSRHTVGWVGKRPAPSSSLAFSWVQAMSSSLRFAISSARELFRRRRELACAASPGCASPPTPRPCCSSSCCSPFTLACDALSASSSSASSDGSATESSWWSAGSDQSWFFSAWSWRIERW
mmetsp:Transcript_25491/g.60471  ORF Transcript_25491/g.60471 Transcript_25491/m.60471 type:complete len:245 (-) Transcript_25491:507-1241(-)